MLATNALAVTGDGFADRCGVRRIVLATLAAHAVRRDELRCHQLYSVVVLPEQPRPVVPTSTRFHADQTGWQVGDQRQQVRACDFRL
jgi:hypothetical protein